MNPDSPSARVPALLTVALLMVTTFLAFIDRQIPNFLVAQIRASLAISDTGMSLIQGFSFAFTFAVFGLPMGLMADRLNRRNLVMIGCLIWSAATIFCGFAESFWHLFLGRVLVGIGEAALAPAAFSLLADLFEPRMRGRVLSIYFLATVSSVGIAMVLIAAMLEMTGDVTRLVPALSGMEGWQIAFIMAGTPGLLILPLFLLVREPVRRDNEGRPIGGRDAAAIADFIRHLSVHRRAFGLILASFAFLQLSNLGGYSWMPSFFVRKFGMTTYEVGVTLGWVVAFGGVTGTILSAFISDPLARDAGKGGRARVLLIAAAITAPVQFLWPAMPHPLFSMALIVVSATGIGAGASSAAAIFQDIVPNRMRGQVIAVYSLVIGIVGYGLGPSVVAVFTDHVYGRDEALPLALMSSLGPAALIALIAAWLGLKPFASALRAVRPA